eukprot:TRINITY_DN9713_c0_g1_i1.p1 TRINITY_DN9713_c0_g1~~TRINITY_DN9713_c0_g1_i1.p1  ORF type:complete len:634 (+),score=223.99 TRINITY_DN9713_c0_g1_i1:21-1922(+)
MFTVAAGQGESGGGDKNFDTGGLKVDEDQLESFEKIRNLLVAGGYFRAMIKTLDHFDKVAGGLAWCITAANENVDISLLFEEHARMGEKITMSENIERALVDMGCPHPLQAQQIYALDCINIFPVIQWLVQKVIEVRKETGDLVRVYSETQYQKQGYQLPTEAEILAGKEEGMLFIQSCNQKYAPKRQYRLKARRGLRSGRKTKQNEDERVQTVLLEYGQGHLYTMVLLQKKDPEQQKKKSKLKIPGAEDEEKMRENEARMAQEREDKIIKNMGKFDQDSNLVKSALKEIMKAKSDEMREARDTVAAEMKEVESLQQQANEKEHGQFNHQRYIHDVEKKIHHAQEKLTKLNKVYTEKQTELKEIQEEYEKVVNYNKRIIDEIDKLNSKQQDEATKKNMQILQDLVGFNENLKEQLKLFKANSLTQKQLWDKRIEDLKNTTPEDGGRGDEIINAHKSDTEKLEKLRELLAAKNRAVASVKRKIDQIPSRRELQQYQRQFVEVFEQMAVKYTETKQYFNLFNSSEKIRAALEHEDKLLNSIQEQYPTIRGNKKGRDKFLSSVKDITSGLSQRLEQAHKQEEDENKKRQGLDEKYINLVEKERQYYAAAKEYQEECKKTEALEERIRKIRKKKNDE